ncbi:hypothetical protein [Sporomusa sp. KB1]|jgi:hypothetical protein|uniref:hypothetical protein n=1 Tax=Sporomusa sp. KB1 TaxID=943346 RepID=UPI0011A9BE16|nr:hypothetical protein [Sporomusa sp. KB1]TWH45168.1 hypothetical protein Salpa_1072 [Sporomusa sp. KB1]
MAKTKSVSFRVSEELYDEIKKDEISLTEFLEASITNYLKLSDVERLIFLTINAPNLLTPNDIKIHGTWPELLKDKLGDDFIGKQRQIQRIYSAITYNLDDWLFSDLITKEDVESLAVNEKEPDFKTSAIFGWKILYRAYKSLPRQYPDIPREILFKLVLNMFLGKFIEYLIEITEDENRVDAFNQNFDEFLKNGYSSLGTIKHTS